MPQQAVEDLKRGTNKDVGPKDSFEMARSYLKNRILVQDRGGVEFKTAGNLLVVEDLKRGTNKDVGPKDIFKMASKVALEHDIGYNESRLIHIGNENGFF